MRIPGNRKLGGELTWEFVFPSGGSDVCQVIAILGLPTARPAVPAGAR